MFAIVSQEPVLFAATIRENILFGNPSADDEAVYAAAKVCDTFHFSFFRRNYLIFFWITASVFLRLPTHTISSSISPTDTTHGLVRGECN